MLRLRAGIKRHVEKGVGILRLRWVCQKVMSLTQFMLDFVAVLV